MFSSYTSCDPAVKQNPVGRSRTTQTGCQAKSRPHRPPATDSYNTAKAPTRFNQLFPFSEPVWKFKLLPHIPENHLDHRMHKCRYFHTKIYLRAVRSTGFLYEKSKKVYSTKTPLAVSKMRILALFSREYCTPRGVVRGGKGGTLQIFLFFSWQMNIIWYNSDDGR